MKVRRACALAIVRQPRASGSNALRPAGGRLPSPLRGGVGGGGTKNAELPWGTPLPPPQGCHVHTSALRAVNMADSLGRIESGGASDDVYLRGGGAGAVWRPPPAKRGTLLHEALVRRPGSCIRRLAQGDRARQMQFSRFLHNEAVTVTEMAETAAARTAVVVAGRDVLAIQDSSELVFGGKEARSRGFGPIG